jgi:hypothetical protein
MDEVRFQVHLTFQAEAQAMERLIDSLLQYAQAGEGT